MLGLFLICTNENLPLVSSFLFCYNILLLSFSALLCKLMLPNCTCATFTTCSQTSAETLFLPKSSGTWGHKGDIVLQRDGERFHRRPQERSVSSTVFAACWMQLLVCFNNKQDNAGLFACLSYWYAARCTGSTVRGVFVTVLKLLYCSVFSDAHWLTWQHHTCLHWIQTLC